MNDESEVWAVTRWPDVVC